MTEAERGRQWPLIALDSPRLQAIPLSSLRNFFSSLPSRFFPPPFLLTVLKRPLVAPEIVEATDGLLFIFFFVGQSDGRLHAAWKI